MNKLFTLHVLLALAIHTQCEVRVEIIENPRDLKNDFRHAEPLCPGGTMYRVRDGTLKCCRENKKYRHCSLLVCDQPGEPGYEVPIFNNKIRGLQIVCPHGEAYRHNGQMHCCQGHDKHRMCTRIACIENFGTLFEDFSLDEDTEDRHGMNYKLIKIARSERPSFCYLPPEEGGIRCRAYIERYYFNKEKGRCEKFVYGGCRATMNNFVTLEECIATCER